MKKTTFHATEQPGILVVIATLGQRTELLKKTLDSVKAQDIDNLDIALVYPLKNKGTASLAKSYNAHSIDDPGSMSAAVNIGIRSATNKHTYITWIGDDDLLTPGSLKASIAALEKNPSALAAFGYCDYINNEGNRIFTTKGGKLAPWLMTWGPNLVPLPGSVFRTSALLAMDQPFDESLKYTMDLDLFLRLRKQGELIHVPKVVASFRWHPSSTTVANRGRSLEEARLVKRRYLSPLQTFFAVLWEKPIEMATIIATRRVNSRVHR